MRALCWMGVNDLQVHTVPDPRLVNPHDAILRVRDEHVQSLELVPQSEREQPEDTDIDS